jgi:hypothetical protein
MVQTLTQKALFSWDSGIRTIKNVKYIFYFQNLSTDNANNKLYLNGASDS